MNPQKPGTLCLLKILSDYSDKDHILSMKDILSKLSSEYGIDTERRAIYRYVNSLLYLGYDISVYDDNGKGYYLRSRTPSETDVRLITDCLRLYSPLSEVKVDRIEKSLTSNLRVSERESFKHMILVRDPLEAVYDDMNEHLKMLDKAAER